LPLKHNDGRPVDEGILHQTRRDILERFDAVSVYPQAVLGIWVHEQVPYEDLTVRLFVDVEDNEENRRFFRDFKEVLLARFEQIEIYIVSYTVEIT
jgi:hypothetical protein